MKKRLKGVFVKILILILAVFCAAPCLEMLQGGGMVAYADGNGITVTFSVSGAGSANVDIKLYGGQGEEQMLDGTGAVTLSISCVQAWNLRNGFHRYDTDYQ